MRPINAFAVVVLAASLAGGCREYGIARGENDVLTLGTFEASTTIDRGVTLGVRTLELSGANLSVDVTAEDVAAATLSFRITTRGPSDSEAGGLLGNVTVDESGDERKYQYKVNSPRDEVTTVTVSGVVPAGTPLVIRAGNGDVTVAGLDGDLTVSVGNGDVSVSGASGNVDLQTANGDIALDYAVMPSGVVARAVAANGDLALGIPRGLNARVEAKTSSGRIAVPGGTFDKEDYGVSGVGGRFVGHQGEGGAMVALQTQNGDVSISIVEQSAEFPQATSGQNQDPAGQDVLAPEDLQPDEQDPEDQGPDDQAPDELTPDGASQPVITPATPEPDGSRPNDAVPTDTLVVPQV